MTPKDRHNLASAYMSAWHAAKGQDNHVVVNPMPSGWFEVIKRTTAGPMVERVRAASLLKSLVSLTASLERSAA